MSELIDHEEFLQVLSASLQRVTTIDPDLAVTQMASLLAPWFERILNERVREAQAEAWDRGMRTGTSRAMRHMSDEPDLPLASVLDNPYRTGSDES